MNFPHQSWFRCLKCKTTIIRHSNSKQCIECKATLVRMHKASPAECDAYFEKKLQDHLRGEKC